jgi:hypothetical protein
MRNISSRIAPILLVLLLIFSSLNIAQAASSASAAKAEKKEHSKVRLFNGKNLDNWVFKLKDNSVDPSKVFTVKDGIINISGSPFGYMRTKKSYSDFKLHVEWRWPGEPTNSGVFVFAQEPDSIWLCCVECQLQAGNAGDFVCMNGADMNERTDKSKVFVRKMSQSSEKQAGEWNTMEVECKSNTIEVRVNGVLQNKATGVNLDKGSICLQSEGKEIQFRNVYLTKSDKKK